MTTLKSIELDYGYYGTVVYKGGIKGYDSMGEEVISGSGKGHGISMGIGGSVILGDAWMLRPLTREDSIIRAKSEPTLYGAKELLEKYNISLK